MGSLVLSLLVTLLHLLSGTHELTIHPPAVVQNITDAATVELKITNDDDAALSLDVHVTDIKYSPFFWPKDGVWTAEDWRRYWQTRHPPGENHTGVFSNTTETWLPSGGHFHSFGFREQPGVFSARHVLPGGATDFFDASKSSPWNEIAYSPALAWSKGGPFGKRGVQTLPYFAVSDVAPFWASFFDWGWIGIARWSWSDIWEWGWVGIGREDSPMGLVWHSPLDPMGLGPCWHRSMDRRLGLGWHRTLDWRLGLGRHRPWSVESRLGMDRHCSLEPWMGGYTEIDKTHE
ncbi:unnamed protein product [Vitrella brassicaformis CCMP3155]|uniref:Plastocyanin-like domain-containing protein n=1 Tax=Vitrella brassicaformis (strain CCMP3155) TaxID=1169540 RepID=A0A0G4GID9_VITBC|nr:unnamed protein product [Vitrella brassicaformis CCMP3155]|eukprot:CEM29632.1 unnamed protein product [Vitrella brassicaformis CCMP3155]